MVTNKQLGIDKVYFFKIYGQSIEQSKTNYLSHIMIKCVI